MGGWQCRSSWCKKVTIVTTIVKTMASYPRPPRIVAAPRYPILGSNIFDTSTLPSEPNEEGEAPARPSSPRNGIQARRAARISIDGDVKILSLQDYRFYTLRPQGFGAEYLCLNEKEEVVVCPFDAWELGSRERLRRETRWLKQYGLHQITDLNGEIMLINERGDSCYRYEPELPRRACPK